MGNCSRFGGSVTEAGNDVGETLSYRERGTKQCLKFVGSLAEQPPSKDRFSGSVAEAENKGWQITIILP